MNFNSPKSEPNKSFKKMDTKKIEKTELAPKPDQKPNDEPKNKIESPKIDLGTLSRNKIEPRKIDPKKEPKHKLTPRKIDPKAPTRHKIESRKIDPTKEPKYKLQHQRIDFYNPKNIKKNASRLDKIKEELKKLDWECISNDWSIITRANQYAKYKKVLLDPTKEVSKENPLYRHKEWLSRLYRNDNWNLNNKEIANLCGVIPSVIGKWRIKHNITKKLQGEGKWLDKRSGKVYIRVPRENYLQGLTKDSRRKSVYKLEHIHKIERYLSQHPQLELSKKYLVDGKYLRPGTEIHHINQIGKDNSLKNLWIYENKKEHAKGELTLYEGLKTLVGTNYIQFKNGEYFLNPSTNTFKSKPSILGSERKNQINYKDINLVKEEIKKINWDSISNDWSIQVKKNQFVQKRIIVDPSRDCSKNNPLHHHKEWVKHIVSDSRYNLTDSRLAKLCGITRDTARYWRERMHGIKGKTEWGFERKVDESDGRIWIKVPKDYVNPVVQKEDHHRRFMLEHRYVIEQHLAKHPELEITKNVLKDGKYLKPEAHVHHINMNYQDNRIENLWVFETDKSHIEATKSLYSLVKGLLNSGKIRFIEGKYHTDT